MPIPIIAFLYLLFLLIPLFLAFRLFYICIFKFTFEPENNSKIKGDNENSKRCKSRSNRPKKQAK